MVHGTQPGPFPEEAYLRWPVGLHHVSHAHQGMRANITLDRHLARRLGPGSAPRMALNMVTRAFTVPSLRSFWRYWNAGFHFYLLYFCYRPLRRFLGHGPSLLLTFAICGFAHDVVIVLPASLMDSGKVPYPFMTLWFLLIGASILAADRFGLAFRALPPWLRVLVHVTFLAATFAITRHIDDRFW